jgi:23S rRNA pseudouridine1911/1915/1917 synthase
MNLSIRRISLKLGELLIIAKPSNRHSVPSTSKNSDLPSIAEELLENYPELNGISDKSDEAGLVNRLDFETSGILLAATTPTLWKLLRQKYSEHQIRKTYLLLVTGSLTELKNVSGLLYGRYNRSKKVSVILSSKGSQIIKKRSQFCEGVYQPLAVSLDGLFSFISVSTFTGARHQVRAFAQAIGHPLLGDTIYGGKSYNFYDEIYPTPSFFLHSYQIFLPSSLDSLKIEIPLPNKFQKIVHHYFASSISSQYCREI